MHPALTDKRDTRVSGTGQSHGDPVLSIGGRARAGTTLACLQTPLSAGRGLFRMPHPLQRSGRETLTGWPGLRSPGICATGPQSSQGAFPRTPWQSPAHVWSTPCSRLLPSTDQSEPSVTPFGRRSCRPPPTGLRAFKSDCAKERAHRAHRLARVEFPKRLWP